MTTSNILWFLNGYSSWLFCAVKYRGECIIIYRQYEQASSAG